MDAEKDYSLAVIPLPESDESIEMVFVEGGLFRMGDEAGDLWDKCRPVRQVQLSDYYIGKYPMTQAQWETINKNHQSEFKDLLHPVEMVTWDDCESFTRELTEKTSIEFSLPTEAQWEFAARGGNTSKGFRFSGSDDLADVAWFAENSDEETKPVGLKQPNELGLYDMSGNVWEWCLDWWGSYPCPAWEYIAIEPKGPPSGGYRVVRGGSYFSNETNCRPSQRTLRPPKYCYNTRGLRVVASAQSVRKWMALEQPQVSEKPDSEPNPEPVDSVPVNESK